MLNAKKINRKASIDSSISCVVGSHRGNSWSVAGPFACGFQRSL